MVKISEIISNTELRKIRREWSPERGRFYFSVVDVIDKITDSTDARNYWKVLKNRLKNTHKELVTECNQLKMQANDGKFYLTDTLDAENILELIKIISPSNLAPFRRYFEQLKNPENESYPQTENESEIELLIDGYQDEKSITILAMVAGVPSSNISIAASRESLIIKGERIKNKESNLDDYSSEELYWGKFSRSIPLPAEIEIESVTATLDHGLLVIKMKKLDKALTKEIAIKVL